VGALIIGGIVSMTVGAAPAPAAAPAVAAVQPAE
jgi:hypothetical protein